jgi:uncharacterized membrane protein
MNLFKLLWKKWLKLAGVIGNFQAQVILTVFYLVIFFPIGVIFRLLADPIRIRPRQALSRKSNFEKWEHPKESLEEARKQY